MAKRKRGPISKRIRILCRRLLRCEISDDAFKEEIKEILDKYGSSGYVLQGIGLATAKWIEGEDDYKKERVWRLLSEVDIRIKELYERWKEIMFNNP